MSHEDNETRLRKELKAAEKEKDDLKDKISAFQRALNEKEYRIRNIKQDIENARKSKVRPITISDHALVRYLERVLGIDIEYVKGNIITKEMQAAAAMMGQNGTFTCGEIKVVMKDGIICTLMKVDK